MSLSQRERDIFRPFPLPLGEGAAKRRVRVEMVTEPFSRVLVPGGYPSI
jgi:hypothetical protein